jgi:hypothetical protein
VTISLAYGTSRESNTRSHLLALLSRHDLTKWQWTNEIRISSGEIPHSHPVLTLNTRCGDRTDLLLATYLHEQLPWWIANCPPTAVEEATKQLRCIWPAVPTAPPMGADDEDSTYLHLIVCFLEDEALRTVLGDSAAGAVLGHWTRDNYTWIYECVLASHARLAEVVERAGLVPAVTPSTAPIGHRGHG